MRDVPTINESAYIDGYSIGKLHADPDIDIDPRWSMADASRRGVLDEFMRGFNDGYEGKDKQP